MSLFDKLKQKSLEKMLEKMSGGSPEEMLRSAGANDKDVSEAMQAIKGMNLSQMMGLLKAFQPGEKMTAAKVTSLLDSSMISQIAAKLCASTEEAPQRIADLMNSAMAQLLSGK